MRTSPLTLSPDLSYTRSPAMARLSRAAPFAMSWLMCVPLLDAGDEIWFDAIRMPGINIGEGMASITLLDLVPDGLYNIASRRCA